MVRRAECCDGRNGYLRGTGKSRACQLHNSSQKLTNPRFLGLAFEQCQDPTAEINTQSPAAISRGATTVDATSCTTNTLASSDKRYPPLLSCPSLMTRRRNIFFGLFLSLSLPVLFLSCFGSYSPSVISPPFLPGLYPEHRL